MKCFFFLGLTAFALTLFDDGGAATCFFELGVDATVCG